MEQKNKRPTLLLLIALELLAAGLALCVFALFHHVIPYRRRLEQGMPTPIAVVERKETPAPTEEALPAFDEEESAEDEAAQESAPVKRPTPTEKPRPTEEPVPTEEPEPLSWAERFAEQFTAEPVWDDLSYRSPDMAVTVTKYEHTESFPDAVYFVADIYLTDTEQLRSIFPLGGTFAVPTAIARDADAIVAVNSDVFVNQQEGFVVRDGKLYFQNRSTADICVLYYDGRMVTYGPGEYEAEAVVADGPWQIWHFGPALLDENGGVRESFNISELLQTTHPRTAIGYYEPGHYCFVVVDGRQGGYSLGANMQTLAEIMAELGCKAAYNLDGGASSVMIFHGKLINRPCDDRNLNDLIAIVEQTGEEPGE